jgi:hypothetical protein
MKDNMHDDYDFQTYLTPRDRRILAELLRQSGAVRKQAEAISTAIPKPNKGSTTP